MVNRMHNDSQFSRRERDNGHEVPLFAPTEEKSPCLDRGSENREGYASRIFSPESDALDATTVDAATELLEGLIDDLSATEASDIMQRDGPTDEDPREKVEYTFNDISEAATFNTARPPDPHEVCKIRKQSPDIISFSTLQHTLLQQFVAY